MGNECRKMERWGSSKGLDTSKAASLVHPSLGTAVCLLFSWSLFLSFFFFRVISLSPTCECCRAEVPATGGTRAAGLTGLGQGTHACARTCLCVCAYTCMGIYTCMLNCMSIYMSMFMYEGSKHLSSAPSTATSSHLPSRSPEGQPSSRVVRPWPRLPREAVAAPSLTGFKARLDGALSTLGWWKMSLLMAGGLEPDEL